MRSDASAGMLFARLQLRSPDSRSYLLASPLSRVPVSDVAFELARAIGRSGAGAQLVMIQGASGEGLRVSEEGHTVDPGQVTQVAADSVRDILAAVRGFSGYSIVAGRGILDDPTTLLSVAVVDATLVVSREGKTTREQLARTREEVNGAGGHVLGAITLR